MAKPATGTLPLTFACATTLGATLFIMEELLKQLKWFQSNLTNENFEEFKLLISKLSESLSEDYKYKFEVINFIELKPDFPFDDLPF